MDIPIEYIITSLISLIFGFGIGYFISSKIHKNQSLTRALRYKNPEAWEIAHCIIAEEDQEKKEKETKAHKKQPQRSQVARKN